MAQNKEIFGADEMRAMFGQNMAHIVYFNFDAANWSKNSLDIQAEKNLLNRLGDEPKFLGLELVASVVMTIDERIFPGWGQVVSNPHGTNGCALVGTLVVRDRASGIIIPAPSTWIGINTYPDNNTARQHGLSDFSDYIDGSSRFASHLMNIHSWNYVYNFLARERQK